jgi:hypothetical protein
MTPRRGQDVLWMLRGVAGVMATLCLAFGLVSGIEVLGLALVFGVCALLFHRQYRREVRRSGGDGAAA